MNELTIKIALAALGALLLAGAVYLFRDRIGKRAKESKAILSRGNTDGNFVTVLYHCVIIYASADVA